MNGSPPRRPTRLSKARGGYVLRTDRIRRRKTLFNGLVQQGLLTAFGNLCPLGQLIIFFTLRGWPDRACFCGCGRRIAVFGRLSRVDFGFGNGVLLGVVRSQPARVARVARCLNFWSEVDAPWLRHQRRFTTHGCRNGGSLNIKGRLVQKILPSGASGPETSAYLDVSEHLPRHTDTMRWRSCSPTTVAVRPGSRIPSRGRGDPHSSMG